MTAPRVMMPFPMSPPGTMLADVQQNAQQHASMQAISDITRDILWGLAPTKDDVSTMSTCLKELSKLAEQLGPEWKTRAFGSVASGFYMRFSDLDVSCIQGDEAVEKVLPAVSLQRLLPVVKGHGEFEVTEEITRARIPILKLKFRQKLDVDLSFQNRDPFCNTQLLKAYATLSVTVRQLVLLIKLWAKAEGVCGAPEGHLSSYSFTLLTIYFLQVDPECRLPVFPTGEFTGERSCPAVTKVNWQCPLGLSTLICRFFQFYATEFHWGHEVVSVRKGERAYAYDPAYVELNACQGTGMPHIEDPFLLGRNLNCVLGWEQHTMLRDKLTAALEDIRVGGAPFGFTKALSWYKGSLPQSENTLMDTNYLVQSEVQGSHAIQKGDNPQSGTSAPKTRTATASATPTALKPGALHDAAEVAAPQRLVPLQMASAISVAASLRSAVSITASPDGKCNLSSEEDIISPRHFQPAPADVPMTSLAELTWSL